MTFLFAGLTSPPVAAVLWGCQKIPGVDWKCQTPGKNPLEETNASGLEAGLKSQCDLELT